MSPVRIVPEVSEPFVAINMATISSMILIFVGFLKISGMICEMRDKVPWLL